MRLFGPSGFRFLRLSDAATTWWRCLEHYHAVIMADWVEQVPAARRALKRATRRLKLARGLGVHYDHVPGIRDRQPGQNGCLPSVLPRD